MTRVSVVIPSWNTRELLRACLNSLEASELRAEHVIVVDNASHDGSADMVARDFPRAELQRNERNEGFARGSNQGLARARGEHVLLLNADTELAPDALGKLVSFLDAHPEYGAVAPRLVSPDGSTQRTCMRFPNWRTPLFYGPPMERWFPKSRELQRYYMRDWEQEDERDVEQPPAACLLLRRAALERVGPFDERLWLYFNDVDLSRRLASAGWRTRYLAGARVLHHVGASTKQFADQLSEWQRNRLVYYRKHHGWLAGVWVKLCVSLSFADWAWIQLARRATRTGGEPLRPMLARYGAFLRS